MLMFSPGFCSFRGLCRRSNKHVRTSYACIALGLRIGSHTTSLPAFHGCDLRCRAFKHETVSYTSEPGLRVHVMTHVTCKPRPPPWRRVNEHRCTVRWWLRLKFTHTHTHRRYRRLTFHNSVTRCVCVRAGGVQSHPHMRIPVRCRARSYYAVIIGTRLRTQHPAMVPSFQSSRGGTCRLLTWLRVASLCSQLLGARDHLICHHQT